MKARAAKPNIRTRRFKVPTNLNFNAGEYYEVIEWSELAITEPPKVNAMTDTELWQLISMNETPTVLFPKFPCHTQAIEILKHPRTLADQIHEMALFVLGLLLDT